MGNHPGTLAPPAGREQWCQDAGAGFPAARRDLADLCRRFSPAAVDDVAVAQFTHVALVDALASFDDDGLHDLWNAAASGGAVGALRLLALAAAWRRHRANTGRTGEALCPREAWQTCHDRRHHVAAMYLAALDAEYDRSQRPRAAAAALHVLGAPLAKLRFLPLSDPPPAPVAAGERRPGTEEAGGAVEAQLLQALADHDEARTIELCHRLPRSRIEATAEPYHRLLAQCRALVLRGEGVEVLLATYVLQRLTGTLGPSVGLADLTLGVPPPPTLPADNAYSFDRILNTKMELDEIL